jgi:protein O-mannosyl-transferase
MTRFSFLHSGRMPYLLLCFTAFLLYSYTLTCGFVYDDIAITVVGNPLLLGEIPVWDVLAWDRPLREFTYLLDHALWGFSPLGYHLQNIVWHAANSCLVFGFLCFLGIHRSSALITALLFCVHPIQSETVSWISGRKDLLCLFFSLASCWLFTKAAFENEEHPRKARRNSLFSLIIFVLAMLSKQVAIVVPLLMAATCWFYAQQHHQRIQWKKLGKQISLPAAIAMFFVIFSYDVIPRLIGIFDHGTFYDPASRDVSLTAVSTVLTPLAVLGKGLWLFVWPMDLTVERAFQPVQSMGDMRWLPGLLLLVGLSFIAWRTRKIAPATLFGLGWLLIAWLPVSGILPVAYLLADRYLYMPGFGFCLLFISFFSHLSPWDTRKPVLIALLSLLVIFSLRTWDRTFDWKNDFTLWESAISARPEYAMGYVNLGNAHQNAGNLDKAFAYWEQALQRNPNLPQVWLNMGNAQKKQGHLDEAETCYRTSLELLPSYGLAHYNLALLLDSQGKSDLALTHLNYAVKTLYGKRDRSRRIGYAHYHIARILSSRGDVQAAVPHLQHAAKRIPNYPPVYLLQGSLSQNPHEARQAFLTAIQLNPAYSEAYFNLGVLEWRLGNQQQALTAWHQAAELDPSLEDTIEKVKQSR